MINDSSTLWIGSQEQPYEGADAITYIPLRTHIRLRARFRPSPLSKWNLKKPLLTLDYQKYTPLFSRGDHQVTKILVSKMTESLYE